MGAVTYVLTILNDLISQINRIFRIKPALFLLHLNNRF
jgi:hypothetical protein